jgi:hypothetical protein
LIATHRTETMDKIIVGPKEEILAKAKADMEGLKNPKILANAKRDTFVFRGRITQSWGDGIIESVAVHLADNQWQYMRDPQLP